MNEAIDYDKIADKVAERLHLMSINQVWGTKECASYFGVTAKHFRDVTSKHHSFPAPKKQFGQLKWDKDEVIAWFEKC